TAATSTTTRSGVWRRAGTPPSWRGWSGTPSSSRGRTSTPRASRRRGDDLPRASTRHGDDLLTTPPAHGTIRSGCLHLSPARTRTSNYDVGASVGCRTEFGSALFPTSNARTAAVRWRCEETRSALPEAAPVSLDNRWATHRRTHVRR